MAEITEINEINYLINEGRVFLLSKNINVFPCSRRGQSGIEGSATYYDPEARLNTERTNRLHTAINGFKDSFISSYDSEANTLTFVLAGYHIEAKEFNPTDIASALNLDTGTIYAHLNLHSGVSLNIENYYTEILDCQLGRDTNKNSLDAPYYENNFFVGISFTSQEIKDTSSNIKLTSYNLPLFSKTDEGWQIVQTSLLPRVEHGETVDSIKLSGDFTVKHIEGQSEQTTLSVTKNTTTIFSDLIVKDNEEVPAFTVNNDGITLAKPVTVNNNLTVTEGHEVDTPKLKVETITSDSDEVRLDKTLNVDTINSNEDSGLTIKQKTKLEQSLEVAGETTLKSNLKVEDNINVGTPTTPATSDNGGYIVAKKDITAEQDLIANRDIKAEGKATVKSLVVDGGEDTDSPEAGTIIATKLVETPTLNANLEISTPLLNATKITGTETITQSLQVQNTDGDAEIVADKAKITKGLTVEDTITATKQLEEGKFNLDVNTANINTLSTTSFTSTTATVTDTATIKQVKGEDIKQKVKDAYYEVPVIFVQPKKSDSSEKTTYQLQISRANFLAEQMVD